MSGLPSQSIPKYEFSPIECMKEGFRLFNKAPGIMILTTILFVVVQVLATRLPVVGSIVSMLVSPILMVGFYNVISKIHLNGSASLNDAIDGIKEAKLDQLMLVGVVQGIITLIGFALLVVPGIYLSVAYLFSVLYVFFGKMPFWDAMEKSRRVITENWWTFFGFVILIGLVNFAGLICLGIGLLVTAPASIAANYIAFIRVSEQIEKTAETTVGIPAPPPTTQG